MNIALSGGSGSGKSSVASYLVKHFNYEICHPGRACREITARLFQTDSKSMLNRVNDAMRQLDPNVWLSVALRERTMTKPLVIDGMRFQSNYTFLKKEGFSLWKIVAPLKIRIQRLEDRGQQFDATVDADHPGEIELNDLPFDVTIENVGNLEALFKRIDQLLVSK